MAININTDIAFTYLLSRRRQTAVAALGVTFGISMFIFMNGLITGTNDYFEQATLSTTPHIRLFNDNKMSDTHLLNHYLNDKTIHLISNPQLIRSDNRIYNPNAVTASIRNNPAIIAVSPQVHTNVIYANGVVEQNGTISGVNILEQDIMFDITSTMIAGTVKDLNNTPNGIIIGNGLAKNLNIQKGDNVTVTTSNGSLKVLQVVGIFETTIKNVDQTKSYANVAVVQQLMRKDRSFITEIYINIKNHEQASIISEEMARQTGYEAESWQSANEQSLAARMIRDVIANSVVITILIVAGFGIYNILNMTIYEKIKEIAILKATGFAGNHIIGIFIQQALFIGLIGGMLGIALGWLLSFIVSKFYIGLGNVEYLPIAFEWRHYIQGFLFGVVTSFFAGYIPAVKASKVDPVKIIRG